MDEINPNDYFDSDDNADMCELEARLYASVHHESVDNNSPIVVPQYIPAAVRVVSNTKIVNNPKTNVGRYWANNMNHNRPNDLQTNSSETYRNKYVPYSSIIAEIRDSTPNTGNNNNQQQKRVEDTTPHKSPQVTNSPNILINQKKQDNRKPKRKVPTERRIINPASKQIQNISQILKDNMTKQSKIDKYAVKKEKATKIRAAQKNNKLIIIDLNEDDDDDDDVIVIPTKPPPTVCLDSSDESVVSKSEFAAPNKVKNSVQHGRKSKQTPSANNSRCPSPSNSIVSDDFIIPNDRSRISECPDLSIAQDEDLQFAQPTVESIVNPSSAKRISDKTSTSVNKVAESINSSSETPFTTPMDKSSSLSISSIENLNKSDTSVDIFATPNHKSKKKENKNYQVKDNSFAAVDVYESESSDMPESIYERIKNRSLNDSLRHVVSSGDDDDDESVNDITAKKTKKLTKRKTSGSGKSSEYNSDSSDYELSQVTVADEELSASTPYSYIMRGDAVSATNTDENNDGGGGGGKRLRTAKKRCKFDSEHHSDDDFITLLSSIIHDASDDDNDDDDDDLFSSDSNTPVQFNNLKKKKKNEKIKSVEEAKVVNKSVEVMMISDQEDEDEEEVEETFVSDINVNEEMKDNYDADESENEILSTGWNNEMIQFYENSWGGENFNSKTILNKMSASSVHWHISNADRYPRKLKGIRCLNCREIGHVRSRCPIIKNVICFMCGQRGHREPRCPNKICLKCGSPNSLYSKECRNCFHMKRTVCKLCKMRGHSIDICPDKWRRYHSTITPQTKLITKNYTNNRVKYCCICAGRGHSDDKCVNAIKTIDYSLSTYNIISYKDLYNYSTIIKPYDKLKFNLITEIPKNFTIKFNFDKNLNVNNFYKRFLKFISLKKRNKNIAAVTTPNKVNETKRKRKKITKKVETIISLGDCNLQVKRFCNDSGSNNNNNNNQLKVTIKDNQRIVTNPSLVNEKTTIGNSPVKIVIDEDSNYSFNEFYSSQDDDANNLNTDNMNKTLEVVKLSEDVNSVEKMSDFIPLTTVGTELMNLKQIEKSIINNNMNDDNNMDNRQEDAKIFLSKEKIKELLSKDGTEFIKKSRQKYNINIILKWHSYSNFLIIIGTKSAQNLFYNDLKLFFNSKLLEIRKLNVLSTLPKNKIMLIKFLRMNLNKLNNDNLGDIEYLYEQTCLNLNRSSDKSRNLLNMILIGQKGLRNGHQYIKDLYNNIKLLESKVELNVPIEIRRKICTNYQHIFSPIDDIDYNELIKEYHQMETKSKTSNIIKNNPDFSSSGDEILLNINYDKLDEKMVTSDVVNVEPSTTTATAPPANTDNNNTDIIPIDDTDDDKNKPSKIWSDKSLLIIIKCLTIMKAHGNKLNMTNKLNLIKARAYKSRLSYNDYLIILKTYDVISNKLNNFNN